MMNLLKAEKKPLAFISLYYASTHGLILFVSGWWFDDWCLMNISNEGLLQWSSEMGRPDVFPIYAFVRDFPDLFYKTTIFLTYYIVAVCFYFLVRKIFKMNVQNALVVCSIYLCIPVNDVRIIRSALPYAVGLMFWFLAFFILAHNYNNLKIGFRISTLTLFFCSFILNSLLVFYGLVLIYIIFKERNFKKILLKADFFLIPFIFFCGKQALFPAHGIYALYNQVSLSGMVRGITGVFETFPTILRAILSILLNPMLNFKWLLALIVLVSFTIYVSRKPQYFNLINKFEPKKNNVNFLLIEFSIGFLTMLAGLYPYVVTGASITITHFNGRNSMLVPFGTALFIDAILKLLYKKESRIVIIAIFMMTGIIHFAKSYSNYQNSYYWVRGLQEYLVVNPQIKDCKTIYIVGDDNNPLNYYIYNGIFEEVYGDETRLVHSGNFKISIDVTTVTEREWYNMSEFDINYTGMPVIVEYSKDNIGGRKALFMRFSEILGHDISSSLLENSSFKVVYPTDDEYIMYIQ